jgi:GDP-L-fucose synthase
MFKNSKIYLAGHTGLLGSVLERKLRVRGYTNIITRSHNALDLTIQVEVDEFFKKERPEYIFLCAGLAGGILANKNYPAKFFHVNIAIQDNVFQAAQRYEVKHLIFYGSSCIYPRDCPQPIKEEYLLTGKVEETSEASAAAKIAGIIACRAYNYQFKTNRFIALVPATIYGPNDNFNLEDSHVLAALIAKIHRAKVEKKDTLLLWGSGSPRREFIFSEDVADASIFAMVNSDNLSNTHYNIGTGYECSIKELAHLLADIIGFKGKICWDTNMPEGSPRKILDSQKFREVGWKPKVSLLEGLPLTYEWYIHHAADKESRV